MLRNRSFRGGTHAHPRTHGTLGLGVRRLTFKSVVREVIRDLPMNRFMFRMENFCRTVMRDEFEDIVRRRLEHLERLIQPLLVQSQRALPPIVTGTLRSESSLKLRFVKSPRVIYTENEIEADDGSAIIVELIDTATGNRVISGPPSSLKIEIVALDGRFDQEDWGEHEFTRNIVHQRENKKPLLTGDLNFSLKEGLGVLSSNVVFTDSSCWRGCRKFRLGARIMQRYSTGENIKEAKSEAFIVKVSRSIEYRKHHPPSPEDEVFRLEKIAKKGPFRSRLNEFGIHTVKELLQLHVMNPKLLRTILGNGKEVPDKIWNIIIEHAKECKLDDNECYIYHQAADRACLILNSVYEVIEASFGDSGFKFLEQLNPFEQPLVEQVKQQAYKNLKHLVRIDKRELLGPSRPVSMFEHEPPSIETPELPQFTFQDAHQDGPERSTCLSQSIVSTSHDHGADPSHQTQSSVSRYGKKPQIFYCVENGRFSYSSQGLNMPSSHFVSNVDSQLLMPASWSPRGPPLSDPTGSSQSQASTSCCNGANDDHEYHFSVTQNHNAAHMFAPALRNSFRALDTCNREFTPALRNSFRGLEACNGEIMPTMYNEDNFVSWPLQGNVVSDEDEITQPGTPPGLSPAWNEFCSRFFAADFDVDTLMIGLPKARWFKIQKALRNGRLLDMQRT